MTAYIARSYPAKRLEILEKRENKLRHSIRAGELAYILLREAEKVRDAKLLVLKGLKRNAENFGAVEYANFKRISTIHAEIDIWKTKPIEGIIEIYTKS